jgi:hypothetical protein
VKKEAHDGEPRVYEKWANARVVYDPSKLSKDAITRRMKDGDFIVRKVEDVDADQSAAGATSTK